VTRLDALPEVQRKIADELIESCELLLRQDRHGGAISGAESEYLDVRGSSLEADDIDNEGDEVGGKFIVPIFSTGAAFASYIGTCPAELNTLGIFT
jgi:hypothetical protein